MTPRYPAAARTQGVEGIVVLRVTVDADGSVAQVTIRRDPGFGLGEAARDAAKRWRYRPAECDGRPVRSSLSQVMRFVLR